MRPEAREDFRRHFNDVALVMLTDTCNLRCRHCAYETWPTKNPVHLDFELAKKLSKSLSREHRVYLTGGEPTLNPRFFEIAGLMKKFKKPVLTTNGHWIRGRQATEEFVSKLPKNMTIRLSIDDFHAEHLKDMKERASLLAEVCKEKGVRLRFYGVMANRFQDIADRYGLPIELTGEATRKKKGQGGTSASFFVSPNGYVFGSEADFLGNRFAKRGQLLVPKPVGHLREGVARIVRNAGRPSPAE